MTRALTITGLIVAMLLNACATSTEGGVKRTQIRDCPPGMILICESRKPQEPSRGGDEEEIPEFDFCRCEIVLN